MTVPTQQIQPAPCPVCDAGVALGADTICDELIECDDCGVELVVLSTQPMVLAEAPQTEEDWGQ
jgi:alpha-aminoadipate carrier protein LysW